MSFTSQPYAGDQNGERKLLVIKGADFISGIKVDSTTTEYVAAGGDTFATAAELNQFKANRAYLKYAQSSMSASTIKTTTSGLFTNSGSIGETGNGSGDVKPIPDPRISHRVTFGSTNGIGASGGAAISHGQQIVISDSSSSLTFDCYFARFFDGFTTGITNQAEIMLVGATGGRVTGGFSNVTGPFIFTTPKGNTAEVVKGTGIKTLKNLNSFREFMKDQIGASLDGSTFDSITYGVSANKTAVFFRGSTDLTELATISSLLVANQKGRSADYISNIHLPLVGSTSPTLGVVGLTFNAVTGGSATNSEFDDAVGKLFKERTDKKATLDTTLRTFDTLKSLRDMTNTAF